VRKGHGFVMLAWCARRTGAGARVARSRHLYVESWRLETKSYGGRNRGFSWEFFLKKIVPTDDLDTGSSDPVGGREGPGHMSG
jgi:hypothetical protein